jgi:hypothetical protein
MGKGKWHLNRKVWLEPDMMESAAYRSLTKTAMWVLQRLLQKREWADVPTGRNRRKCRVYEHNGLAFTYAEAQHFGIGVKGFWQALKTLYERGFIDIEHQGGAFGRDFSRYKLIDAWRTWNTPEWKPRTKKRVLQQGLDVQTWKRLKQK